MVMRDNKNKELKMKRRLFLKSKKIATVMAAFCGMLIAGFGVYSSQAAEIKSAIQYDNVDQEEAVKAAILYAEMDRSSAVEGQETFKDNIYVSNLREIYDFSEEVSSYLVEFADENNQPAGYVVVGASDMYAPIIEFAYDGCVFLYDALEDVKEESDAVSEETELNDVVLYYNGAMNYYISEETIDDSDTVYGVFGDVLEIDAEDLIEETVSEDDLEEQIDEYEKDWKYFNKEFKNNLDYIEEEYEFVEDDIYDNSNEYFNYSDYLKTKLTTTYDNMSYSNDNVENVDITVEDMISNDTYYNNSGFNDFSKMSVVLPGDGCQLPKTSEFPIISNPGDYEVGYHGVDNVSVPAYWRTYLTFRTFGSGSTSIKSSGIAACNLINYWYYRSYSEIKTEAWQTIYKRFAALSGSSNSTIDLNSLKNGVSSYFNEKLKTIGGGATVTADDKASVSKIKKEIDNGNPPILIMRGHFQYATHACLCLGYKTYRYHTVLPFDATSEYLQIADGRTESTSRYIHYYRGFDFNGCIDMIKVDPYPNR